MAPEGKVAEVEVNQDPLAENQSVSEEPIEGTQEIPVDTEGEDTTPDSDKPSQEAPQITLEQIQKHPAFSDLQSKVDRVLNVNKTLNTQLAQMQTTLTQFRTQEKEAYIAQYGDTPETRARFDRLVNLDEREAKVATAEANLAPIQKTQTCNELMTENGIPEEYRAELMAAESLDKMEERAKVLKSVLSKIPSKTVSKNKGNGQKKSPLPALSHIPDKAQGSVAPQSKEAAQEAYIRGDIKLEEYKKIMAGLGHPQY